MNFNHPIEQATLDYDCALKGHTVIWTGSTTELSDVPAGEYTCQHCCRTVSVTNRRQERLDTNPGTQ